MKILMGPRKDQIGKPFQFFWLGPLVFMSRISNTSTSTLVFSPCSRPIVGAAWLSPPLDFFLHDALDQPGAAVWDERLLPDSCMNCELIHRIYMQYGF